MSLSFTISELLFIVTAAERVMSFNKFICFVHLFIPVLAG